MNNQRSVNFSLISDAFNIVKERWQPFVLAGLIAGIALLLAMGVLFALLMGIGLIGGKSSLAVFVMLPIIAVGYLILLTLTAVLQAGMYHMALKAVRGEPLEATDILFPLKAPLPFFLAGFVIGIATVIGACLCYLPGLVVAGVTKFTFLLMLDKKLAPMDAIKQSVQMLKDNWLMATLFFIVASLVGSLGAYACYVGLFFSMPIMFVAVALAYRDATAASEQPETATA